LKRKPLFKWIFSSPCDAQMFSMGRVIAVPGRASAGVVTTLFDGVSNRNPRSHGFSLQTT